MQFPLDKYNLWSVICFIIRGEEVLLIKRTKKPWIGKWNGLGGKINEEEHAKECLYREVLEEAQIDLNLATKIKFAGIVTWENKDKSLLRIPGMYAYIANLPQDFPTPHLPRNLHEGTIDWKPMEWAMDKTNKEVADNIPYFLPEMLKSKEIKEYHFKS